MTFNQRAEGGYPVQDSGTIAVVEFDTFAEFAAANTSRGWVDGQIASADGVFYLRSPTSTLIDGLPGWALLAGSDDEYIADLQAAVAATAADRAQTGIDAATASGAALEASASETSARLNALSAANSAASASASAIAAASAEAGAEDAADIAEAAAAETAGYAADIQDILAELSALDGVTASAAELNILDGATLTTDELNILDGATLTTAELNILDGATLTVTELNYVDGVTSAIQPQLNGKQAAGATLTSLEALALVAGDIIYATAADTVARLPKGTAGQQLVMNAGATAPEWGAGGASGGAYYENTLTTWALSATAYTFAHGLGGVPNWVTATLVCKVADGGWAVGDEMHVPNDLGGGTRGLLAGFNSTSVFVKANGALYLPTKTTTSYITPTDTKWDIRVRAWI